MNAYVIEAENIIKSRNEEIKKLKEALDEIAMYADETGIAFIAKKALKETE